MSRKHVVDRTGRQSIGLVSENHFAERHAPDLVPEQEPQQEAEQGPQPEAAQAPRPEPAQAPRPEPEQAPEPEQNVAPAPEPAPAQAAVTPPIPAPPSVNARQTMLEQFGAYELVWEICRDALSTTYAARAEGIEHLLAVRIFSARVTDAAQIRSIQKAANRAAELTHANLVTVYENGVGENGAPYLVTDWVEGENLTDVFQVTKRLDIGRFLTIFNQVCEALMEAHSRQLIHGNLSPNKIILSTSASDYDNDQVKLIDFGMPPDPVQNAFYLSPEQKLDSIKVDARTDIYSLGCIMYEALVGSPPFVGHKLSHASLNYLHELANQYSPDSPEHNALKLLDCIIIKCLQQNPAKRFRTVRELFDALRLVNDCICGGSTKKLPPKAEKLLLFRFLDYFDKKIVACMFVYLLLGGLSLKFIGETQLQKYIDEAQLAEQAHLPLAQEYWRGAIQQAEWLHKPPGLLADLHWELAETFKSQATDPSYSPTSDALAKDAIEQYQQALPYYSHGSNYKAYELVLLHNLAQLTTSMAKEDANTARREAVRMQAQKLLKQKKYTECAAVCSNYLRKSFDKEIAYCASSAYTEIGIASPPAKALRSFERALYFVQQSEANDSVEQTNMRICLTSLHIDPDDLDARRSRARKAFEEGDVEATIAELQSVDYARDSENLCATLHMFQTTIKEANFPIENDPNMKRSIAPLERALQIEEKSWGLHSRELVPTLIQLAESYRLAGDKQKAISTYAKLYAVKPATSVFIQSQWQGISWAPMGSLSIDSGLPPVWTLRYANLLENTGHRKQAIKLLEKIVYINGHYQTHEMLFVRLVQLYADEKLTEKAHKAANQALKPYTPPPIYTTSN